MYRGWSLEVSQAKANIKFESKKGENLWGLYQDSHPQHFTMKAFKQVELYTMERLNNKYT